VRRQSGAATALWIAHGFRFAIQPKLSCGNVASSLSDNPKRRRRFALPAHSK